jgi:uncharacterized protein YegJ (DUF2314 family)
MGDVTEADKPAAYRRIGGLLAELAGDDCLAVAAPQTGAITPYAPELLEKLRGDDPLGALSPVEPPVLQIRDDDPLMVAAVAEARRRWPEFVAAFERRDGEMFSVKSEFTEGDASEFIWVEVTAIENDVVYGKLGNEPVALNKLKLGQTVRVPRAELNDWMYMKGDKIQGGFTLEALKKAQERKSRG